MIGDGVGMQVDLGELRRRQEEPVGLVELGDLLLELEVLEDLPRLGREAFDVVSQVLRRPCQGRP